MINRGTLLGDMFLLIFDLLDGAVNEWFKQLLDEMDNNNVPIWATVVDNGLLELINPQVYQIKLMLEQITKVHDVWHPPAAS